jgi:hypothetical protein
MSTNIMNYKCCFEGGGWDEIEMMVREREFSLV